MYESFKAVVGVKSANTLLEELAARDSGMAAIRQDLGDISHKVDLLTAANEVHFSAIESQIGGINNWLRAMVIGFLGFGATIVVTVMQMR
jgi:hypothetical protein